MKGLFRSLKILRIILKYRLDTLIPSQHLPWYVRVLMSVVFLRFIFPERRPRAERLRKTLEDLGPVFIKFGQTLSTRRDLLPDDIADELAKLQDKVPAFDGQQAKQLIEKSLGEPVEQVFKSFDTQPLASASVAQVHAATLKSGQTVVVKVVRPGIHKVIRQDMALLYMLAELLQSVWSEGKRLRPVEVVEEYEQTIFDELDLRKEAANASQLRRNFADSEMLYVPEVYWDYTRANVLVLERIYGIPVADVAALHRQNTNMKLLAERGVEIFFTQVFRDSFFQTCIQAIFLSQRLTQTRHNTSPSTLVLWVL